jgi:hypothetical protein
MIDYLGLTNLAPINMQDPVNRQHPINHGRVGWWIALHGLDGGAFLYDLMGLVSGTLTNMGSGSGWHTPTRKGAFGHLVYDGSNDYVQMPYTAALNCTGGITIAAWIFLTSAFGGKVVVGKPFTTTHTSPFFDWLMYINSTVTFRIGTQVQTSTSSITQSVWTRIMLVADGTNWNFYLNGILDKTLTLAVLPTNTNSQGVRIGANVAAGEVFTGGIDDVAVWNRGLSATEAQADYDLSRTYYPGVLNRISFDVAGMASTGTLRRVPLTGGIYEQRGGVWG